MDPLPPHNPDNERAVLGSVLMDRDVMLAIDGLLTPQHFYIGKHEYIYEAMQTCFRNTVAPDYIAVSDVLKRAGRLEDVGGIGYLIELTSAVPTSSHAEHYARLVRRDGMARNLFNAAGKIAAVSFEHDLDEDALVNKATQTLTKALTRAGRSNFVSMATITDRLFLDWQEDGTYGPAGTPTGYRDLDELIGGWMPSDLIVLAARPSVGKTSFALCTARYAAAYGPVLFFSQEMSEEQLTQRMVSVETGINTQRVRFKRWHDQDEKREALEALGILNALDIQIDPTPSQEIATMRRNANQFALEHGTPSLVIVDYLQLSKASDARSREQEVAEVSRGLKAMAKDIKAPVLAVAQLNRAVEGRAGHIPVLSDLRESGQIEQDCDVVMFLHREELYDKETDKKGIAEIHIAKHRSGPTGIVPLYFDASTTAFRQLVRYSTPEGY